MEKVIAKRIIEASEVIGLDLELREDYSGRGSYGSETYAIVGDEKSFRQAICYAAGTLDQVNLAEHPDGESETIDLDQFCEEMASLRTDNMGRYSMVWY